MKWSRLNGIGWPLTAAIVAVLVLSVPRIRLDAQNPTYTFITLAGLAGTLGTADGAGSTARFNLPYDVAVNRGTGALFIADAGNSAIRKITPAGVVTTFAGVAGTPGDVSGVGSAARFNHPHALAIDDDGNLYVADSENDMIRKITSSGNVTTLAGTSHFQGSTDGVGSAARFKIPEGIALDGERNVYVADTYNGTIRKVTQAGVVTTVAGVANDFGSIDGTGSAARFNWPYQITLDSAGNIYAADGRTNMTIRRITPSGVVTTLAGLAGSQGAVDGTGSAARFSWPQAIEFHGTSDLYVGDLYTISSGTPIGGTIRKVTTAGVVTTFAGLSGVRGTADGSPNDVRFGGVFGIAFDIDGTMYIVDEPNHTIRQGILGTPAAPSITTQPSDQSRNAGQTAQFTTATTANPRAGYQWQVSTNGGATWTNLTNTGLYSGTDTATLTITSVTLSENGAQYRSIAANSVGSATSGAATLEVLAAPTVTTQPTNQSVASGQNAQVTIATTANPAPAYQWQVSTNGGSTWTNLTNVAPYSGVTTTTLSVSGATFAMSGYQYRATAANSVGTATSNAATLTVLDLTAPAGTVVVNGGATYTNAPTVTLTLSASDTESGVAAMGFSNDSTTWSNYETYATSTAWTLGPLDGTKTVHARFRDASGNVSTIATDSIILDTIAPTVTVTSLSTYQTATSFSVAWSGSDALSGIAQYDVQVRIGSGEWSDWITATTTTQATYPNAEEGQTYRFRARARDAANNQSAYGTGDTQTIIDTTAPSAPSITINGGAITTTSAQVTGSLSASDASSGVGSVGFSNDGTNWGNWQTYSSTATITLSSGDGLKTVYARFRDTAGNISPSASDTITLDTTVSPDRTVSVNSAALYTNTTNVTLTIGATPGTAEMQVSNDGGFANTSWQPYQSQLSWTITQHQLYVIPRVVYARFRDMSGAISPTIQDDIILDVIAPGGAVTIQVGGSTQVATLIITATDDVSGVSEMSVSNDPSFAGRPWEAFAATKQWTPGPGGTVFVRFRDRAGNISPIVTPGGTCSYSLTVNEVIVSALGGSGFFDVAAPAGCGWTATPTETWLTLTPGSGAGNARITYSAAAFAESNTRSAVVNVGSQSVLFRQLGFATGMPGAPVGLTASIRDGALSLNWQAPGTGGTPTGYVIEAGAQSGRTDVAIPIGSSLSWTYNGALADGRYYFRVRAVNSAGTGVTSNEFELIVGLGGPPSAPTQLSGNITTGVLTLQWLPAASGATVDDYVLEAGSGSGLADLASVRLGLATSFQFTGVPFGRYFFRVKAANARGVSGSSNEIELAYEAPGLPSAPQNLIAQLTGATLTLTWNAGPGAGAASAFVIEAGSATGLRDLASINTGSPSTTWSFNGIPPGLTFVARLRALNSAGLSGPSNEVTIGPRVADTPSDPAAAPAPAVDVREHLVTIDWTTSVTTPTDHYFVELQRAGDSARYVIDVATGETLLTLADVPAGWYTVTVRVTNGDVIGPPSHATTFTVRRN